jgi:hypothetical protein
MPSPRDRTDGDEPIGIVISRGQREEQPPRFSAYIWGPAPEVSGPVTEPPAR